MIYDCGSLQIGADGFGTSTASSHIELDETGKC
jgi:hypothetical protein